MAFIIVVVIFRPHWFLIFACLELNFKASDAHKADKVAKLN